MRLTEAACLSALFLVLLGISVNSVENAEKQRKGRFFDHDTWGGIPEGPLRLTDHARVFTTKMLDGLLSEVTGRESAVVRRRFNPFHSIFEEMSQKASHRRGGGGGNPERETEDGEATEVIVEEPHKEVDEVPAFHPLGIPLSFSFGFFTPWWKGPNVCIERNEIDEEDTEMKNNTFFINFEATQCIPTETTYTCTKKIRNGSVKKTIVMKYQCCHGHVRNKDGKPGCNEVNMDPIVDTLRRLDADKFSDMLDLSGLSEKLDSENFTIFAPINDAVLDFEEETENNEIRKEMVSGKKKNEIPNFVGGHIVEGLVNMATVENDRVMTSLNGKTTIRINKYRPGTEVLTANCVPINSKDNLATNGLIQLVADVLPMPRKSVIDVVSANKGFSIFSKLLSESDLMDDLKDAKKSWTLFIPTDEAFKALDKNMLQRMLSGEGCVDSILKQHVLQGTVCSHAVLGKIHIQNYLGKPLTLQKDEAGAFHVNTAKVNTSNVLATNGVVHFIDEVIVPPEAHNLLESLQNAERTDLLELINMAELESTFEGLKNVSFFAPSRDALKRIPNDTMTEWRENPEKLREILLYHIAAPQTMSSDFRHNKEMASLAEDHNIRLQLHELFPGIAVAATAQCSMIVKHDNGACGAVSHYVDKILTPPKPSILEALKSMEGHEIVRKLLEGTDLEKKLASASEGPYTLLAPTDEAFKRFTTDALDQLLENKTSAEQILKMHILPEPMCCSGVQHSLPFRHHYVRTLEGNLLPLHRSGRLNRVRFGTASAVRCDVTARNGLVHSVNKVILPTRRPVPSFFGFDIFNF